MRKGRLILIDRLFTAKEGSSYNKVITETFAMAYKRKRITVTYPAKDEDIRKYEINRVKGAIVNASADEQNTISYHNSIRQIIKIFDKKE